MRAHFAKLMFIKYGNWLSLLIVNLSFIALKLGYLLCYAHTIVLSKNILFLRKLSSDAS